MILQTATEWMRVINGLLEKLALSISKIGTFEDEVKRIKDEIKKYN